MSGVARSKRAPSPQPLTYPQSCRARRTASGWAATLRYAHPGHRSGRGCDMEVKLSCGGAEGGIERRTSVWLRPAGRRSGAVGRSAVSSASINTRTADRRRYWRSTGSSSTAGSGGTTSRRAHWCSSGRRRAGDRIQAGTESTTSVRSEVATGSSGSSRQGRSVAPIVTLGGWPRYCCRYGRGMSELVCPRCGGSEFEQGFVAGHSGGPFWFTGPLREVRRPFGVLSGRGRHRILASACTSCGRLEFSRGPEA